MSGAKGRLKLLSLYASAFIAVGFVPAFLYYLAASSPFLQYLYLLVWAVGLASDAYTTFRLHRRYPGGLELYERSGYFKRLYRRFGFWAGLAAFIVLVELPLALTISFFVIPAAEGVFGAFSPHPDAGARLASSLAFFGLTHLSAVPSNLKFEPKP